jgi:hypothetical protein
MGALGVVATGLGRAAALVLGDVVVFGFAPERYGGAPGAIRWVVDAEETWPDRLEDAVGYSATLTAAAVLVACGLLVALDSIRRRRVGAEVVGYLGGVLVWAAVGAVVAATVAAFVEVANRDWRTVMYFPVVVLGVLVLTLLREVARAVREAERAH